MIIAVALDSTCGFGHLREQVGQLLRFVHFKVASWTVNAVWRLKVASWTVSTVCTLKVASWTVNAVLTLKVAH